MVATPATFKAFFPNYSDIPDATVQVYLDSATRRIGDAQTLWEQCGLFDDGVHYLAAHQIYVGGVAESVNSSGTTATGNAAGRIESSIRVEGKGSIQYENIAQSSRSSGSSSIFSNLNNSSYGQEFEALLVQVGLANSARWVL